MHKRLLQTGLLTTIMLNGYAIATANDSVPYQQAVLRDSVSGSAKAFVIDANLTTQTSMPETRLSNLNPVFTSGRVKTVIQADSVNPDFLRLTVGPE